MTHSLRRADASFPLLDDMETTTIAPPSSTDTVRLDERRLAAVRSTGLLDSEVEEAFDRLTRLAVRLVKVPASFISLVDEHRDFYKSACGFGDPLASARAIEGETFCHYTIQRTEPLVIPDTAADPLYQNVPTVHSLGVAAYVGVPLVIGGQVIGAFCTIDMKPRAWTPEEIEVLVELAASAQREIELRSAAALATRREAELKIAHGVLLTQAEELRTTNERLQENAVELEMQTEALAESTRTERSARDEAQRANLAKSQFLAMMSHELRTPLNAIGGYASLMEEGIRGAVTPGQLDYLGRIRRSQQHLLGLINGILNYAQIGAGSIQYADEIVQIDQVLGVAESLTSPQMKAKGMQFEYDRTTTVSQARGDSAKVQQIFINLFSNAVKFTDTNGRIRVTTRMRDERTVAVDVTDTGHGIAPDHLESVFEPFVQVDARRELSSLGTGLGLAISRELAQGMSGDLLVESRLGVGTTFTLLLPAA